jgi:hypothetical protein
VKYKLILIFLIALPAFVSGCATREELIAKSAIVPFGTDLSGQWQLRPESQDTVRRIGEAEVQAAGGRESIDLVRTRKSQNSRRGSSGGTTVHVFLETGRALKITQTEYALFISFDRAIVEEYRFGEKRVINVGPIVADRVSGWQDGYYIIETLDEDEAKLIETYRLTDDGRSLIRTITVFDDGKIQMDIQQEFDHV